MTQILGFLAAHLGFLWRSGYRVTGSEVTGYNGGDSLVLIESEVLRLRLVTDKTQLFLDLQAVAGSPEEWWSVDLVRRLFLGACEPSAVMDQGYAEFIGAHLEEIEARFAAQSWTETHQALSNLRAVRSKEMSR